MKSFRHTAGDASLPTIQQLREMISTDCHGNGDEFASFVKLLPLRLMNTGPGADQTLSYVVGQRYSLSARAAALFRDIELLRDIHTPKS